MDVIKDCAFMAHINEVNWPNVVAKIRAKFKDRDMLIVGERTPYEHMHFYIKMSDREYRNLANSLFKQKYGLRGRAVKDKARQYGKLKKIRDKEKLLAYMLKDGIQYNKNVWTNMVKDMLEKLHRDMSYKKEDKGYLKFINYLKTNDISQQLSYGQLQKKMITKQKLALTWLEVAKERLPSEKTLWYYAYKANIISGETYIDAVYNLNINYEFPITGEA